MVTQQAVELIRATGRFTTVRQPSTGTVTCTLATHYGATIYVVASGREFHIRTGALEFPRFPNYARLYSYVRQYGHETRWVNDNSYVLPACRIADVLEIILGAGGHG